MKDLLKKKSFWNALGLILGNIVYAIHPEIKEAIPVETLFAFWASLQSLFIAHGQVKIERAAKSPVVVNQPVEKTVEDDGCF